MKPKTDLFDLIKSMSKSEKRYFKLYASMQSGDKIYIKLFDEIDSMKFYDEAYIKKKYKEDKFTRQLTFTKNYLYNLIFKGLYNYFGKDSIESKLNDLVLRAKFFYNRALFNLFRDSVTMGKKLSLEYERFGYFIQFVNLEKVLIFKKIFPDFDEKIIIDEEELITEKIGNLSVYDSYIVKLIKYYREEGRTRDEHLYGYIERLKQSPLLKKEDYALSSVARERFYFIHQLIADIEGDLDSMYLYCNKRLDILLENPKPFSGTTFNYWLDILIYIILLKIYLNKDEDIDSYLELFRAQAEQSAADKVHVIYMDSYIRVQMIIKEKNWEKAQETVQEIESKLNEFKGLLDRNLELLLYFSIVKMYIEMKEYNNTLKYINLLLNNPNIYVRKDLEYNARLLNLIVHYELGNYDYLQYLIINTYKFLNKRKKIYKLETQFLRFIKRLPDVVNDKQLINNFEMLEKGLEKLYKEPHERNIFLAFDYLTYIRSKLETLKNGSK